MGRKVITMAKELGTEPTKYLLHSHDRLVTEETVAVQGSALPSGLGSKSSIGRVASNAGHSSPGSHHQLHQRDYGDMGEEEGERRESLVNIRQFPAEA